MPRRKERTEVLLNLLETPQTWFHLSGKEENVAKAPPEVFDTWISQYVEEITDVDRDTWEVWDRWEIINAFIREGVLALQIQEEKASIVESVAEEKASTTIDNEAPSKAV